MAACTSDETTPPGNVDLKSLTSSQWQEDLRVLYRELKTIHPNLFHSVSESEFQSKVDDVETSIPTLSVYEIIVSLMEVADFSNLRGRDGHTDIWPFQPNIGFSLLPLRLYLFADGLYVVDTDDGHRDLIGQRVVQIGNASAEEVMNAMSNILPSSDNESGRKRFQPLYAITPELLQARGFIETATRVNILTRKSRNEGEQSSTLETISFDDYANRFSLATRLPQSPEPITLSKHYNAPFWFHHLNDSNMMYLQYNTVEKIGNPWEPMWSFATRLEDALDAYRDSALVIDLRHNGGGNSNTYPPLLKVIQRSRASKERRLFALIGRHTFSAAGNFLSDLKEATHVTLVGEPSGASPNMYGDSTYVRLPHSGIEVSIATIYWQKAPVNDPAIAHVPDIWVAYSSEDYFAARTPLLDAVMDALEEAP